jgi:hypothetical protein
MLVYTVDHPPGSLSAQEKQWGNNVTLRRSMYLSSSKASLVVQPEVDRTVRDYRASNRERESRYAIN